jgi:hypothetical protein
MSKYKHLLTSVIVLGGMCLAMAATAQQKTTKAPQPPKIKKIPPPPIMPPPPPRVVTYEDINPFDDLGVAFISDVSYIKTDTAFIVQQKNFEPNSTGTARLNIESKMYPANFTVDSLAEKDGRIELARTIFVNYQDGEFHYDGKYAGKSRKLIFVNSKDKKQTVFTIVWDTSKAGAKKKRIKALIEDSSKTTWKAGERMPISPSM